MKTIIDPKEQTIQLKTTCAILSRKPAIDQDNYKTAVIGLYAENNPHKSGKFPNIVYEFTNIEKVRIKGLNVSYYLEGNDLIINDLEELMIIRMGTFLVLKGYQFEVERRKKSVKK
ncbi:MAG: hypothetical protein ACP5NW_04625 [Candidatus Woesearchaeota archaeon]